MKTKFYLVVNSKGTVKVTKNAPSLNWDEVAVGMSLTLPNALFQRPRLEASVTVPDDVAMPHEINVETIGTIEEALRQATGVEVKLELVDERGDGQ